MNVPTYDWLSFIAPKFKKVPGVKHQFQFFDPGIVICKALSDSLSH